MCVLNLRPTIRIALAPPNSRLEATADLLELFVAEHRDGVLRVTLRGQIDYFVVAELGDKLAAALVDGDHRVELNMAEITYCGAAGLRALTDTHRRCVEHDGSMRIIAPSRLVARLLEVTGLNSQLLVS